MLEEVLRPEVRDRLTNVYRKGQVLLKSGLASDGYSFQKALEDFYDLNWEANSTGYRIHNPYQVEIFPPLMTLDKAKENHEKLHIIPRDLIRTLVQFSENPGLTRLINEEELSYERARESYRPDLSKIDRNCEILTHGGMTTALFSFIYTAYSAMNQNFDSLKWTVPLFFVSLLCGTIAGTSSIRTRIKAKAENKTEENLYPDTKRRKQEFWSLHELSIEADKLLKEYYQYFN